MRIRSLLLAAAATLALAQAAQAQFLIFNNFGTGTNRTGDFSDVDDGVIIGAGLGGTFNIFGSGNTTVDISTNGSWNFSGSAPFSNGAFPSTSDQRFAPFWDDGFVDSGSSYFELAGTGFYSGTWENWGFFNGIENVDNFTYQAAWFNAATTVTIGNGNTFDFLADDIAFDYQNRTGTNTISATVGLNQGNGTDFAVAPGTGDGSVDGTNMFSFLPIDSENDFLLFRWNGTGYDASIASFAPPAAVPEPTTIALGAIGLSGAALGAKKYRARRAAKKAQSAGPVQADEAKVGWFKKRIKTKVKVRVSAK